MKIIYTDEQGRLCEVVPSIAFKDKLEKCAEISVPKGVEYKIVKDGYLPSSDNWFDAWVDTGEMVEVDLEKARIAHKQLMIRKMHELVKPDEFGRIDLTTTIEEIKAIDFDSISTLEELYNTWPASISRRTEDREYKMHG